MRSLLLLLLSVSVYVGSYANNVPQTQTEKKVAKSKFNFNLFKFTPIETEKKLIDDSLKTNTRALYIKDKKRKRIILISSLSAF